MGNEVWNEIGVFLNNLRCGNVKRESHVRFPELQEAEQEKRKAQEHFLKVFNILEYKQKQAIENYLEAVKHQAFMEEEQAYCQGYADCIQLLAGVGLLKSTPYINEIINKINS